MDNNYNGYSPENGYDPENSAPLRDDATMLADDFAGGDQFYGQNADNGQNAYSQPYNNDYDQSANYGQNAYDQNSGYGESNGNYPVTPVTPVNPPPPRQDFNAMYDKMFNKKKGASGISITSMVFSILGLFVTLVGTVACCCGGPLLVIPGILCSIVGLVLGILNMIGKKPGSGLAITGIIVGAIGLIWGAVVFLVFGIPVLMAMIESADSSYYY